MTAIEIIQQAARELGLPTSAVVAAATDPMTIQLLALLNAHGRFLMKRYAWTALHTFGSITTVSGTGDYAVPAAFDRLIEDTEWDRTNAWRLLGPISPQTDRFQRESLGASIGPRRTIRLLGTSIQIYPTPTVSGDVLAYEYVTKNWARSALSVAKSSFTVDTDTPLLDDQLMVLGLKYRFRHSKGLESETYYQEHEDYYDLLKGGDIGTGTISLGSEPEAQFITLDNVPDTGYG